MASLVIADLHLTSNPRDEYRFDFLEKTLPAMLRRYKVDELILLGDITHQKDNHGAVLVNRVVNDIKVLSKNVGCVIIDLGNHDYANPQHPFFKFLRHLPGVRFIPKHDA